MKKYTVESPLKLDGQDIEIGATIDLSDEQANPLLETKPPVITLVSTATVSSLTAPENPEERIAAIREVISQMDKADASLFLADGTTPDVKALSAMLGWNVSAADRNAAIKAE